MADLLKIDIPEGPERDAFLRRLATFTSTSEARKFVEMVRDLRHQSNLVGSLIH
jgi:hypothetical protein